MSPDAVPGQSASGVPDLEAAKRQAVKDYEAERKRKQRAQKAESRAKEDPDSISLESVGIVFGVLAIVCVVAGLVMWRKGF